MKAPNGRISDRRLKPHKCGGISAAQFSYWLSSKSYTGSKVIRGKGYRTRWPLETIFSFEMRKIS
jgi:hypothetical protein